MSASPGLVDVAQLVGHILLVWAVVAVALAAVAEVFRPRRINGPPRLSPGEPTQNLVMITGVAMLVAAATLYAFNAIVRQASPAATQPGQIHLTDFQTVLLGGVMDAAVCAALLIGAAAVRPEGTRRLGLGWSNLPRGLVGGLFALAIVLPWTICVDTSTQVLWDWLKLNHQAAHNLLLMFGSDHNPWVRGGIILTAGLTAPVAEEIFFRGFVQTAFRYALRRPWLGVLIAAGLFALVHPWWMMPPIFFLGVCLGYIYERTGNLWMCIVLHALFNLSSIELYRLLRP